MAALAAPDQGEGDLAGILHDLHDTRHLIRERALKRLATLVATELDAPCSQITAAEVWQGLSEMLPPHNVPWEAHVGALGGCTVLVGACSQPSVRSLLDHTTPHLLAACVALFEHPEPRVRTAVGELVQALAAVHGASVIWPQVGPRLMELVEQTFDRDGPEQPGTAGQAAEPGAAVATASHHLTVTAGDASPPPQLSGPLSPRPAAGLPAAGLLSSLLADTYKPQVVGRGELRHGSEGWRCLESCVRTILAAATGAGSSFRPFITVELVQLTGRCMHHPNRFVREAAHTLAAALFAAYQGGSWDGDELAAGLPFHETASSLASFISDGLQDNWSQVRYMACQGVQALFAATGPHPAPALRQRLLPTLLPGMCLNRYFVADGVRRVAQEAWRTAMGEAGRQAVAEHINVVCAYYVAQSKAVHHGAREAACACMAELAEKVDPVAVAPHIPDLLRALLLCCKDMAWPVRDAGCVAAGRCTRALPDACRPFLAQFVDLWVAHLWDNVQSVRANSAAALADALHAYPSDSELLATIQTTISTWLPRAEEQTHVPVRGRTIARDDGSQHASAASCPPAAASGHTSPRSGSPSGRYSQLGRPRARSPSPGRPLSPARLQEQQMKALLAADPGLFGPGEDLELLGDGAVRRFSAVPLVKGDGCMDFGFARDQEPWEAADGAVFLVAELATVRPELAAGCLEDVTRYAARAQGFEAAPKLRETVWRMLPRVAKAVGKQRLKRHLEPMLQPLFADLECGVQLTETAAGRAVAALRDFLGPNILAARLTEAQVLAMRTNPHVSAVSAAPAWAQTAVRTQV